jgi:hypothetical protein
VNATTAATANTRDVSRTVISRDSMDRTVRLKADTTYDGPPEGGHYVR